jgi:hypothetical protein
MTRHTALASLPVLLAQIAAAAILAEASAGCSFSSSSCAGYTPPPTPPPQSVSVSSDVACAMLPQDVLPLDPASVVGPVFPADCSAACPSGYTQCSVPADYVKAFVVARNAVLYPVDAGPRPALDAGDDAGLEAGADGGPSFCPSVGGTVAIQCEVPVALCEGRRTDGVPDQPVRAARSTGEYLAACSYLEAVSVHAFARLHAELAALGAPRALLADVRRAQRDEVRHARLTRDLARRHGVEAERPAPPSLPLRSTLAIALENAVEGCVREAYGAVVASIRAARAADPEVRAAMESIARDEREHAALSWRIAAWLEPGLTRGGRDAVGRAMREAVANLEGAAGDDGADEACRAACGLPTEGDRRRAIALLDGALFGPGRLGAAA